MTTKSPGDNPDSIKIKRTSLLMNLKGTFFGVAVFIRMPLGGSLKSIQPPQWFPLKWSSWKLSKLYIKNVYFCYSYYCHYSIKLLSKNKLSLKEPNCLLCLEQESIRERICTTLSRAKTIPSANYVPQSLLLALTVASLKLQWIYCFLTALKAENLISILL